MVGFYRSYGFSSTRALQGNSVYVYPSGDEVEDALADASDATCVYSILTTHDPQDALTIADELSADIDPQAGGVATHTSLLRWQGVTGSSEVWNTLYMIAGVLAVVIAVAGVSLVYNSFAISVAERTRQFGLLASLGASKRQLRRTVLTEALVIGVVGIPAGLALGVAGCAVVFGLLGDPRMMLVALAVIGFFCYIAVEQTSLNWFSSYAVFGFAVEENIASRWASYFFIAITAGRMLSGILSLKIKDHNLMRIGEGIIAAGILLLALGGANPYLLPVGISLVGLGCAPVYPSIIHSTPTRFTPSFSASVMAVQIGCAYLSNVSASPLFGVIGQYAGFVYYPYYLLAFLVVLALCNEAVRYKQRRGVCGTLKSNTTSN